MHQKPNCKCAYCGVPIYRRPDRLGIRNFCSTAHAGLARIEREQYDTAQEGSLSSFMNMRRGLPKPITKLVQEQRFAGEC
jgi:hypothetical protein